MTRTKAEIIGRLCEKHSVSKNDAANLVEAAFEIIKTALERGEKVKILNFGNFAISTKNPRRGRNPQTGAEIIIPGHKVLTFKPSPAMRKIVNTTWSA